jgi:hypothetical protein
MWYPALGMLAHKVMIHIPGYDKKMSHLIFLAMTIIKRNIFDMKKYCILFGLIFLLHNAFGEIKNGYGNEILQLHESLKNLTAILREADHLPVSQRRQIESKITKIKNSISFYKVTESLLSQFKMISPDLYAEIDTIKDRKGRSVSVYVKFVPINSTKFQAWGSTHVNQSATDADAYCSEYGDFSVSVKIWIVSKALIVLSHELGHVKYQVPNLVSYLGYYKQHYSGIVDQYDLLGHNSDDPSGKSAYAFAKRFRKQYSNFLRVASEKVQNPLVIMDGIRKHLHKNI